jgi:hypothetical protein
MSRLAYEEANPIIVPACRIRPRPARVKLVQYVVNHAKGIVGLDLVSGAQLWNATINLLDLAPSEGCVWLDNNGQNKGLMDDLIRLGVIEFNDRFTRVKQGYVFECRLLV